MKAVAFPAVVQDGKVYTPCEHELHREQWFSWFYQPNRRITRKFEKALAERYSLNNGVDFCICISSDDCSFARYELDTVVTAGQLHIIN